MKNYSISKPEITLETAQKNYENARGQLENIRRGGTEELKAIASQVSYWGGKVNEIKNQGGVVDTDKDNNEVIYNGFKSSFIDEDAYNWRRNTRDSSIPAYGSKNFFINRKNELATQIQRESAQLPQLTGVEESGYNLYKTNPDVMRYGTDEQKIAYNYYSTLDRKRNRLNALSAEYNAVLGILNANETKGVHLNKEGKVDTRSGITEAQREKDEYGVVQDFYKKDYSFSPISILPEARAGDEQARYERNMETEGKIVLADDKIKAYKYYDENKDNEYADGLFGRIGANFKSGTIGEKIAETGANSWEYATDDIEAAQVYQQLDKRLRENNKEAYKDNNAFDTFVSTLSNYAPQFINQKKAEIKGKIAGAALGYFMGNAGAGARIGGAAASSADMFRRIAGSQYVELLQNSDMSEEDIKIMATNTALIESALEFGLSYIADKLIFGGETVGKKLGAEKLEDGIISILKKGRMSNKGIQVAVNGIKFIGKQAIEGIGEGTEEFLQTGTEIVARKHAEKGETLSAVELLKETFDFSSYTKEDFAQMKSAGLAAFIISAGSTGTMKSAVSSYMDAVDVVKTEEFGKMIKQAKLSDEYIADAVTICLNSENAEVRGLARKIDNAMQNNQTVSDKDIGRLFKYSTLVEKHNPFEITGGYVEKELKLEQSKSGLVTVYSKDWALGPDSAPVKVIEGLAKLSNSRIVIEDLDPVEVIGEDGEKKLVDNMGFVQDGVIHINSANVKTRLGAMVTLHEVTHNIENSDLYGAYKKLAFDILYGGENTESYKEAYNTIAERYGDKVSSKEDIDKELVANFTMTKLDEKVINRIVMQNRNVAVKIYNALKTAYNKIESFITGTEQDLSDIERALDIFDRALAERRETIDNSDLTPFVDEEGKVQFGEKGNGEKRYLLNENFVNDYDDWVANGRADRQSLNVGTTSSALQSIGVKDQKITWDTNKINASLKKHSYLTDDILKQVPEVLEKPIIVMQSKGFDSRITMFGEVYDSDGLPIMAVLELLPLKDKSGVVLDEIKVVSTHSRKNNNPNSVVQTQSIIDTSDILYVEPNIKRTNNWLTRTRLQLPFGVTNYGSIKRITYPNGNVNTNNMQKSQNDAQGKDGRQHLLGGETSVVANNKTLAEARRMNLKGEPQAEIFKKTGWYKGIDNKWRYEIPDDNARFERKGDLVFKKDHPDYARYRELLDIQNRYILEMEGGRELAETEKKEYEKLKNIWNGTFTQNGKVTPDAGTQNRLEAYFDHPELYDAYPQLKDLKIVFNKDYDGYGEYRPDIKTIVVREGLDNEFAEKVLLHEVQHAIQDIEGFEIGSNREEALENVRAEAATELINIKDKEFAQAKTVQEVNSVIDRNLIKWYNSIYGNVKTIEDVAYRAYLDYYGEREAREVVERAKMSSEERKRTFPEREYLIKPFTKGNYNENSRQNQTLYSSQNSNVSNKTQKEKSIEIHGTQKQHLLGAVIEKGATTEENYTPEYNSIAKSRTKLERYENEAVRKVADAMSVRLGTAREFLKPIIQEMSTEYMKTGKLSQETVDRLFEEAYKNGKIVNDEAYKEYADLRNCLRNTKIYFDSESAADIPDFFKDIRRYMGRLSVSSTNGTSVDSIYQELNEMHPSLFPEDILSSSDRMLRIMEVSDSLRKEETTLDAYYNTDEAKGHLKHEFEKAVYAFKDNLYEVKHFNDSLEKAEVKPGVEIDADAMQSVYDELAKVQKQSDKVMNKLLLTKDENAILEDMLKGKRSADVDMIPNGLNKGNIMQAYEAKAPVRALQNIIEKHKKAVRNNRNDTAMKMIELSDFWKDKKNGIMYMRETQERNIYDIVGDKKQADKIIETYFTPVHEHEAQRTRFKHDYFDRVRKMDIDLRVRSGNKNTESEAIQFIGEVEGDIADLEAKAEKRKLTDDENDRLINLKGSLAEFKRNNPNLDYNKINSCIKEFHKIYDELFAEMNRVRIRNGYAPVEYRKNYFPHFLETGTDDITGKIAKALGINVDVTELPTDLTGRTENFKPGIAWVQHVKRRNTNETKYDAIEGFQKYIEGVSDVIFHTDDIQNLRALERSLRYKYSEKGVKGEIDALRDRTDITDDERETLLDEAGKRNITSLGNYVNNLTEYTNLLANKKSMHDRSPETMFGRKIYNLFNWANSRVASNMVVGNLSTAITNFIPLTQATAVVGNVNMMIGFNQTVKNFLYDDGLAERSSFLTNRFGQDKLISKSKVADVLVTPMEFVDELTAGTIWRARYYQNIKKGMSDAESIKDADSYAAGLIADRSKGALPTVFSVKNPLMKTLTAFQVETNNQLSHLFKDIPKEAGEKLALVLFKYFLGAYLFNDVYEKVVGRRPALDPLSWTNEFVGDLTGYQMPNSIDIIASLVKREKVDFSTTKFKNSQAIANLGKNIVEDVPFVGGLIGGGRVPISAAAPDFAQLVKLADSEVDGKKKAEIIHKNTISGGLINILMPYAGSQLTKTMKGIKAFAEGGSYSLNNDGEKQLQYAVDKNSVNAVKSVAFGKNSTEGARNWVEEGFGSLTAEQTDLYQRIIEDKKTSRTDVYNAISNARKAESVKDGDKSRTETQVRHEIVSKAKGLSWKQKYMIEYSFMSDENKEKIKAMTNNGVSQDTAYRVLYEYADSKEVSKEAKYKKYYEMSDGGTSVVAEKWGYEPELSVIKREALAHDSKLTAEEKQTINTALFGESETEYDFSNVDNYYYSILSKNQKKGYDQYIKLYGKNSMNARTFYYAIKVKNSKKDGKESTSIQQKTRLRKAGFTLAQANRIYNILN